MWRFGRSRGLFWYYLIWIFGFLMSLLFLPFYLRYATAIPYYLVMVAFLGVWYG